MEIVTLAERPNLEDAIWRLSGVWPRFMHEDPVADLYYGNLSRWSEHSLVALVDGTVVARAFSATFSMDVPGREALPDDGWDGVVRWSDSDQQAQRTATHVSAIEVAVATSSHGTGVATRMVKAMILNADRLGFRELVAPVRPSHKHLEPGTPMRDYVARVRPDGFPEDPWMRIHARLGAETLSVCPASMTIRGTIGEWAGWTEISFDRSGDIGLFGFRRGVAERPLTRARAVVRSTNDVVRLGGPVSAGCVVLLCADARLSTARVLSEWVEDLEVSFTNLEKRMSPTLIRGRTTSYVPTT